MVVHDSLDMDRISFPVMLRYMPRPVSCNRSETGPRPAALVYALGGSV